MGQSAVAKRLMMEGLSLKNGSNACTVKSQGDGIGGVQECHTAYVANHVKVVSAWLSIDQFEGWTYARYRKRSAVRDR